MHKIIMSLRKVAWIQSCFFWQTQSSGSAASSDESGEDEEGGAREEEGAARGRDMDKETFVLEVDDAEDIDIISMLIDPSPPVGATLNNVDTLLGWDGHRVLTQQMFSQVWNYILKWMEKAHSKISSSKIFLKRTLLEQ
jgi:hypothetical protein